MNKITEVLKLVEEALTGLTENDSVNAYFADKRNKALAAIREALADHSGDANEMVAEPVIPEWVDVDDYEEPVKQEPVAIGDEWKPCMKLPIVVHVREQREGETHVSTREGITPILPTDLIMRGVAGEEYPIGYELFNKTYTFEIAAPIQPVKQEPVAWVDLTKEELHQIEMTCETSTECYRVIAKALKDRNAAPVQTVKQEPVGYTAQSVIDWLSSDERTDVAEAEIRLKKKPSGRSNVPLYAAPVDAIAIRAEALEEAAKWFEDEEHPLQPKKVAAAIRGLK